MSGPEDQHDETIETPEATTDASTDDAKNDEQERVGMTIGHLLDMGNDIIARNVAPGFALDTNVDQLSDAQRAMLEAEHLEVGSEDATSHVLEQLATDPSQLEQAMGFLRGMGRNDLADAIEEEIRTSGTLSVEFLSGIQEQMGDIGELVTGVHERLERLRNPETRPKLKHATKELRGVMKDMGIGQPIRNKKQSIGRNSPCPCGSGKKYKNCGCGRYKR